MARVQPAEAVVAGVRLVALQGDITRQVTDAIVNAANSTLMGGGGVDGAIHRAGGPQILEECRRIVAERGPLPPGQAVITTGGRLPARWVIHTVGPIWRGGGHGEPQVLRSCYRSALELARRWELGCIAFPSISTGAYGYPIQQAAPVAVSAVVDWLREQADAGHGGVQEVRFVLFTAQDLEVYRQVLAGMAGSPQRP